MSLIKDNIKINYTRDYLRSLLQKRYNSQNCNCVIISELYEIEKELQRLLDSYEYQEEIDNILIKALDKVLIDRLVKDSLFMPD